MYPVTNIYTKTDLFVKCGKCPACLQEKAAHRVSRIKATQTDSLECLMVGLTYRRGDCPYIDRQEAYEFSRGKRLVLNVYRDTKYRKVRTSKDYKIGYKKTIKKNIISQIEFSHHCNFDKLKDLKHEQGKIGVTYYKDLQRFFARLRLNLKRKYHYDKSFKAYNCSEYGSKSLRPHFHLLLFVEKGDFEIFRNAIIESWPFSDLSMFPRAIEKSYRGASYVASYVNSGSKFPKFLKDFYPPKHSYSKGFGLGRSVFSLSSILSHFERGSLSFGVSRDKQGIPTIVNVPFPAYVIHRYFPRFKGYNRISPSTLSSVMLGISNFQYDKVKSILDRQALYFSEKEFNQFSVMLNNAYKRFLENAPSRYSAPENRLSFYGYCRLHRKIWNLHSSTVLKLHLQNDDIPLLEKYDNLQVVKFRKDNGLPVPPGFESLNITITDPNFFSSNLRSTRIFTESFHENIKHRSVTNAVMSAQSDEW